MCFFNKFYFSKNNNDLGNNSVYLFPKEDNGSWEGN